MEDFLQTMRGLKALAGRCRDLEQYQSAVNILEDKAVPQLQRELSSTSLADRSAQLASELSDCFGMLGALYRRWALESETEEDRRLHLRESVEAYKKGCELEKNPKYRIVSSYNMVNRLVSHILLEPYSLTDADRDKDFHLRDELHKVEFAILEQLKEKREKDLWALADLALVRLFLGHSPARAYADFEAASPPGVVYEGILSTLRPLANAGLPAVDELKKAVELLERKLNKLQNSAHG